MRFTPFSAETQCILDFVDNDGSRIEKRTGIVVFEAQEQNLNRFALEPIGKKYYPPDCELEMYLLNPALRYEIHLCEPPQLLKTITFRRQMTVQCR